MSSPSISKLDHPAHNDLNKRYFNYENCFNCNLKCKPLTKNLTPNILFSHTGIKTSSVIKKINVKEFVANQTKSDVITKTSAKSSPGQIGKFWSPKNVLKLFFIMICWGFCLFQTIDIFKKYSSYPMDVNVIVEEMKLLQLPGITVCNNNM